MNVMYISHCYLMASAFHSNLTCHTALSLLSHDAVFVELLRSYNEISKSYKRHLSAPCVYFPSCPCITCSILSCYQCVEADENIIVCVHLNIFLVFLQYN